MKRAIQCVAVALTVVLGSAGAVPALAATGAADRKDCGHSVPEQLTQRWQQHRAAFGCPTGDASIYGNGMYQWFENGAIAWSPSQGNNMVVSAYRTLGSIVHFDWGSSDPFHYVDWLVNIRRDGQDINGDQECGGAVGTLQMCPEQSGSVFWTGLRPGQYRIVVEGCDLNAGSHQCRQGWTLPVYISL
ncbi:hypothetical protein GCM10029978_044030 [Actinoallomurus acanthiterrae]